jgi:CDGSH-type Zn-finger protein
VPTDPADHRTVRIVPNGPILIEGPIEIHTENGTIKADRFTVAICTCRRTRNPPFCDTSHRRRQSEPAGARSPGQGG